MGIGWFRARQLLLAALLILGVFLLSGCDVFSSSQNTFAPEGDVANRQKDLFLLVLWPALAIGIGVFAAIIYILVRFRRRGDDDPIPEQVHGNMRLELAWTIAPTLLLIGIAVPTLIAIVELGGAAGDDAMPVTVHASRFSWSYEYPTLTDGEGNPLFSEELYVPVDQEIYFALESSDVIHSFWVPKLAGKQDVIPGRTNHLKFTAEEPGTYDGQCAEFCGIGHPVMRLTLHAVERGEFDDWAAEQLADEEPDGGGGPGGEPPEEGPTEGP